MLIDTHCHIHEADYPLDIDEVLAHAREVGVQKLICVGTSEESSRLAVQFASHHDNVYSAVGVHPHEAKDGNLVDGRWNMVDSLTQLLTTEPELPSTNYHLLTTKTVAIGEIGLDYFYSHSPRDIQIKALEAQISLALDNDLPIIFHVRDASSAERRTSVWHDFWPIIDNFHGIRGELHSFTDTSSNLEQGLKRGLYVGVNGISTFTKNEAQQAVFASIPLDKLLLETDAPFLTPVPFRGKVNEPAFVRNVAEYHAQVRHMSLDEISAITTANATALFAL
jgi:TatD DNase family protein